MPQRPSLRTSAGEQYRRSPALVLYWASARPACFDCISGTRTHVTGEVVAFLERLDTWKRASDLTRRDPELGAADDVKELLEALATRGLVQRRSDANGTWPWRVWAPEAAFFHFGTRMNTQPGSPFDHDAELREKARVNPPPPPTKSMAGARVRLPPIALDGALQSALTSRRTWRRFSARPVALADVATLLNVTWGVQKWGTVTGQGRVALKTSPSGGARHSIEAYVIALNVSGLAGGLYHYDAARHELVKLTGRISKERLAHVLANQRWFLGAGALVVMSAVFARAMWRYPFSRAYRAILAEAGHLGQTFCVVATSLGLAPFCTMAFRDRELEDLIGVDGIAESPMYVVGVGTRPRGRIVNPGRIRRGCYGL